MAEAPDKEPGDLLHALHSFYSVLPFEYLFAGHCVLVASWFLALRDKYLASYWVSLLGALGGGLISSLLLQMPQQAPLAIFALNSVGVIFTVCWWAVNYVPLVPRLVAFRPVQLVIKCCSTVLRASLVAERVDLCVLAYPGVVLPPLLIGTIAGSGGAFAIGPLLAGLGVWKWEELELVLPSFVVRSAFAGALCQYLLVHVFGLLSAPEGKALVISLYLLSTVASDLTGWALDYTYPLAYAAHTALNVPMPDHPKWVEHRKRRGRPGPALDSATPALAPAAKPETKKGK